MDNSYKNAGLTVPMFFMRVNMHAQPTMIASVAVQPSHNNSRIGDSVIGLTPPNKHGDQSYPSNQISLSGVISKPYKRLQGTSPLCSPHTPSNTWWVSAELVSLNCKQVIYI